MPGRSAVRSSLPARAPASRRRVERAAQLLELAEERARVEERRRLGRELHDGTGQLLSVALLQLGLLAQQGGDGQKLNFSELRALLENTLTGVRQLSRELHPPKLVEQGLGAALAELAASVSSAGLEVSLIGAPHLARPLPPELAHQLFRIAQTAVANVVCHAGARRCTLALFESPRSVRLEIRDDGAGFDPLTAAEGVGLAGMRERARSLDATWFIESTEGEGTRVVVEIPR